MPVDVDAVDGALRCPGCLVPMLCQRVVTACMGTEDSGQILHVSTSYGGMHVVNRDRQELHHGRRGSVFITFDCESCRREAVLRVMQHKGATYLDWMPEGFRLERLSKPA